MNNKHEDSGRRCLMGHGVGEGQCIICSKCHEYLSLKKFVETECPAVEDKGNLND